MTDNFFLKEENQKLSTAVKILETKFNFQNQQISALKEDITDKDKKLAEIEEINKTLSKRILEEKSNSKNLKTEYDFKIQDLQNSIFEKEKALFSQTKQLSQNESLTNFALEKARIKSEFESKFGQEIQSLKIKINSLESEISHKTKEINNLNNQQIEKTQKNDQKAKENILKNKNKIEEMSSEIDAKEKEILSLKSTIIDQDFLVQKLKNDLIIKSESFDNQLSKFALQSEKIKTEKRDTIIQNTLECTKLKEENRKLKMEVDKLSTSKSILEIEIHSKKDFFQNSERMIEDLQAEKDRLFRINQENEKKFEKVKREIIQKSNELESIESVFRTKHFKELADLNEKLEKELKKNSILMERINEFEIDRKQEVMSLKDQLTNVRNHFVEIQTKLEKTTLKKTELKQKNKQLEIDNHKMILKIDSFEKNVEVLTAELSKNKVSVDEIIATKSQSANIALFHREMDLIKEKLEKTELKYRKCKEKLKGIEGREMVDFEHYGYQNEGLDQDYNEYPQKRNFGYFSRENLSIPNYYAPNLTNFDQRNDFMTGNRNDYQFVENEKKRGNEFINFDKTLPKEYKPKNVKEDKNGSLNGNEIRIIDESSPVNFSFSKPSLNEVKKEDLGISENALPVQYFNLSKKERLDQMIRSGNLLFNMQEA